MESDDAPLALTDDLLILRSWNKYRLVIILHCSNRYNAENAYLPPPKLPLIAPPNDGLGGLLSTPDSTDPRRVFNSELFSGPRVTRRTAGPCMAQRCFEMAPMYSKCTAQTNGYILILNLISINYFYQQANYYYVQILCKD